MDNATATLTTTPAVRALPLFGPPTTTLLVSGGGFDPFAEVDIYFDLAEVAVAVTNKAGSFGGWGGFPGAPIKVQVPAGAVPGTHWVTAKEPPGQPAAQTSFLVRTDWAQFRFEPCHTGVNPYENVLSTANVGNLEQYWGGLKTSDFVGFGPAVVNGVVYFGSGDGHLYALDVNTGNQLWKWPQGSGSCGCRFLRFPCGSQRRGLRGMLRRCPVRFRRAQGG